MIRDKKKLLVSFSGGRTSAYMMAWIYQNLSHEYDLHTVFANTGKESPATLEFIKKCELKWAIPITWIEAQHKDENGNLFSPKGWKVSYRKVSFDTASRKGEPFEEMISVLGIPTTNAPFCSDQLKRKPIEAYIKNELQWKSFYKAIGIRIDEIDRCDPKYKEKKIIYPLISMNPMRKTDIIKWFLKQEFDLEIHEDEGNCDNCWKKDIVTLVRNAKRVPDSYKWWQNMTDKYGHYMPRKTHLKPPFNFYRGNLSPKDIFKLSELPDERISKMASREKLDGCSQSCEVW